MTETVLAITRCVARIGTSREVMGLKPKLFEESPGSIGYRNLAREIVMGSEDLLFRLLRNSLWSDLGAENSRNSATERMSKAMSQRPGTGSLWGAVGVKTGKLCGEQDQIGWKVCIPHR